tara:strand:+ start:3031 stop:3264 length:234 start_codon:yes stop_codon:yes gene_type:complete
MYRIGHDRHTVSKPAADKLDNGKNEIEPERPADSVFSDIMMVVMTMMMLVTMVMSVRMMMVPLPRAMFAHIGNSATG